MWLLFATSATAGLCAPGETELVDCLLDDGGELSVCAAESTPVEEVMFSHFSLRSGTSTGQVKSVRVRPAEVGRALSEGSVTLAVNDDKDGLRFEVKIAGDHLRAVRIETGWAVSTFDTATNQWSSAATCPVETTDALPVAFRVLPHAHDKALYSHLNGKKEQLRACVGYSLYRRNARFDAEFSVTGQMVKIRQIKGSQTLIQCGKDALSDYEGPKRSGVARVWVHSMRESTRAGATGSISNIHREVTAADDLERAVDDSAVLRRCRDLIADKPEVRFQILIDAQGRVTGRPDVRSKGADEAATTCVSQAIDGLRVPAPGRPFSGRGALQYHNPVRPRLDVSTADM
ncbi:MAG: hypothetical protein ACI9MC_003651 [Kiritimatiellia bacterium]|jgi:hypothetical protein